LRHDLAVSGLAQAALFCVLTAGLGGIAVSAAVADRWVIAVAAFAIAAWMASLAWAALRRIRR